MIADLIAPRYRKIIYTVLGTLLAIEAIWNVVPDGLESRAIATLGALGFVLARGNTTTPTTEGD